MPKPRELAERMTPMKPARAWAVVDKEGNFISAANNPEVMEVWPEDFPRVPVLISEDWRPISEAPKDGTVILVTGCNGYDMVSPACWVSPSLEDGWDKPYWRGWPLGMPIGLAEPTHFMPLPAPPEEGE